MRVRAAFTFGKTCLHLLDVGTFDRYPTLDRERAQREEVDGALSLSSDSPMPSLYARAYALYMGRMIADSRDLQALMSVYSVLIVADHVMAKFSAELALASPLMAMSMSLSSSTIQSLKRLTRGRDMLSRVLCCTTPLSSGGRVRGTVIPWDDIIVSVRWIKKAVNDLTLSIKVAEIKENEGTSASAAYLKICDGAHLELTKFDRALGEYWNRPVLLNMTTISSSSSKLRLWKEGGHAAVPPREDEWQLLQRMRAVVKPFKRNLPSFVDTVVEGVDVLTGSGGGVDRTCSLRKEWLCLYSTFYWMHTNESSSSSSSSSSPASASSRVDVEALMTALQADFSRLEVLITPSASSSTNLETNNAGTEGDTYGEADYPLLADKDAGLRVREEWARAGDLSCSLLVEPSVIAYLLTVSNLLAGILKNYSNKILLSTVGGQGKNNGKERFRNQDACVSIEELQRLSSLLSSMISMGIRYTFFDVSGFREMQTLLWSVEAVLALRLLNSSPALVVKRGPKGVKNGKKEAENNEKALHDAEEALVSLARVFTVQFDVRLGSLLYNNLVGMPLSYMYMCYTMFPNINKPM